MTLLINGCSFTKIWRPNIKFVNSLGCDSVTNIAKVGTGSQRALRTTIEWIAQNGDPQFVIVPIALFSRWEMSVGKKDDDIDGTWMSLQHPEYLDNNQIADNVPFERLKTMIENYYTILPNIRTEWDRLFTDIIALSGFLKSRNIRHLIFDMCNLFDMKHIKGYKGFSKLKLIKENKNIIDIFGFCGNKYMYDQLPDKEQDQIHATMHHHEQSSYRHLENFILDYYNS